MENATDDIEEFNSDDVETYEDELETTQEINVISFEDIKEKNIKKKTVPFLNKFEKARIMGVRKQQLSNGAEPKINTINLATIDEIVEEELRQRKIPLIIRRKLPNGVFEDWKLDDFMSV